MLLKTPVCDFGWKAPSFTLRDSDGNAFSLQEHIGQKGLLIAFICNHCPYVKAIATFLAQDTATLKNEGINVLAIMSNDYKNYPEDSPVHMKKFAAAYNFSFPYLIDEDQSVGKAYGAVCTPDFFGFNNKGELQYRGRLDNQGMNPTSSARVPELLNAMKQIARSDQGPKEQIPSMGCSIKWK